MSTGLVRCELVNKEWHVTGDPFVLTRIKNVFGQAKRSGGTVTIPATPEQSRDLLWFKQRYQMAVNPESKMRSLAATFIIQQRLAEDVVSGAYNPEPVKFARGEAPRDYQWKAANLFKASRSLLLADEVGMGKTAAAIAAIADPKLRPAVVIAPNHLTGQWKGQIRRFLPALSVHVIGQTDPYSLKVMADCPTCSATVDTVNETKQLSPRCPICKNRFPNTVPKRVADVTILAYSKMLRWPNVVGAYCKTAILEEVHACRSYDTQRWRAVHSIAKQMEYRLGLSATPLFNLGGEAWNVMECINPGFLGDKPSFQETWCGYSSSSKEPALLDPESLGAYLRSSNVMLRRTAIEVGVPVHDCEIIHQTVDSDTQIFENATSRADEMAKIILGETASRTKGMETMQFDAMMRQATGLAKAPAIAAFTEMLLEQDESVVMFAWHRSVHDFYMEKLAKWNPVLYTGSETVEQKEAAVHKFCNKEAKVILISLRAGEGLDGLQHASCTAVVAELDWTWSVMKQNIGRVARDGQKRPCKAYFMVSEFGSDPIVSQALGLKKDQLNGLIGQRVTTPVKAFDSAEALRKLARLHLDKKRRD